MLFQTAESLSLDTQPSLPKVLLIKKFKHTHPVLGPELFVVGIPHTHTDVLKSRGLQNAHGDIGILAKSFCFCLFLP
jgi:hypothetical protein